MLSPTGQVVAWAVQQLITTSPQAGWAEQDPEQWWQALRLAVRAALSLAGVERIDVIGLSGQMHGTVLIDERHNPLYPAVIWLDRRSRRRDPSRLR